MPSRVELQKVYYHPRTHQRITQATARTYFRRTGKRIRPQHWLILRNVVGDTRGLDRDQVAALKRVAGRITYTARLTRTESILRTASLSEKRVRVVLGDHRIYKKLYDDFEVPGDIQRRGMIRVTINGTLKGRHIKKVIHLGFHKGAWERYYGSKADAKEGFKDWLVAAILSNVRRRGLRLSNPIQSQQRIQDLETKRTNKLKELDLTPKEFAGGIMEQIRWATEAIKEQKKSRQLRGATIRVEKII